MLESIGQPIKAFEALRTATEHFGPNPLSKDLASRTIADGWYAGTITPEDHLRVIGLYQKLGQIAIQMSGMTVPPPFPQPPSSTSALAGTTAQATSTPNANPRRWDDAAEHYLSSALTAILQLGLTKPTSGSTVVGRDVNLPGDATVSVKSGQDELEGGRIDRRGLGMTMEALSEVYARKGQNDLAGQLLIQAVSTLLPPQATEQPSARDRCQGESKICKMNKMWIKANVNQLPW